MPARLDNFTFWSPPFPKLECWRPRPHLAYWFFTAVLPGIIKNHEDLDFQTIMTTKSKRQTWFSWEVHFFVDTFSKNKNWKHHHSGSKSSQRLKLCMANKTTYMLSGIGIGPGAWNPPKHSFQGSAGVFWGEWFFVKKLNIILSRPPDHPQRRGSHQTGRKIDARLDGTGPALRNSKKATNKTHKNSILRPKNRTWYLNYLLGTHPPPGYQYKLLRRMVVLRIWCRWWRWWWCWWQLWWCFEGCIATWSICSIFGPSEPPENPPRWHMKSRNL